jgi:preprotein translocase subunit YajC
MLISHAYAQAGAAPGGADFFASLIPFILIFVIMYFLIIRPQRQRVKSHQEMVKNLRRGDTVVTAGGIIGKVVRVIDDSELQVEIADDVRVRVARSMVVEIRSKSEPLKDEATQG